MQKCLSSLCSNFNLNWYTVYKLNTWPLYPANNFTLKFYSNFTHNCQGIISCRRLKSFGYDKVLVMTSKENTKFCLSLHYNGDESYLYVSKTKISKFKGKDNINWYNFCLGDISQDFIKDGQSEISLSDAVYNFLLTIVQLKKEEY